LVLNMGAAMHAMRDGDRLMGWGVRIARSSWLVVLVGVLLPSPLLAAETDKPAKGKKPAVSPALRKIAEGYLSNRGAFKSFRCEFSYRVGSAPNLARALKNGPTVNVLSSWCKWLIAGRNICYSREIDEEAKAALERSKANPRPHNIKGQKGFIAAIPLSARGYLTDGRRAISYDPDFVANLMGPKRIVELIDDLSPDATPWALGGLGRTMTTNPGRWILDGKLGAWRFVGAEEVEGGKRLLVECKRSSARLTYYFDPARGFLPVRRIYRLNDGRESHTAMTEVRKCLDGRWFPARVVKVDMRAGGEVWRVQEIKLSKLDAEAKVKPEEISLVLRRGIQVVHVDDLRTAFRLQVAERIGVGDLEALHVRCNEARGRR
jgi:hypothetical protein